MRNLGKRGALIICIALIIVAIASYFYAIHYRSNIKSYLRTSEYTLKNGLKVYIHTTPGSTRVHAMVAVKAGSKNTIDDMNSLAHIAELSMANGSKNIGTLNYESEKPLLDKLEELYENYRHSTSEGERAKINEEIEKYSRKAARFAIEDEYANIMNAIGASNSRSHTMIDATYFEEKIPVNQIDNWTKVQAERFLNPEVRLFAKTMNKAALSYNASLRNDETIVSNALANTIFANHPYENVVIPQKDEFLNPSIRNVKRFIETYYVPNNMAIILSGDVNHRKTLKIIKKYFEDAEPNNNMPEVLFPSITESSLPPIKIVNGNRASTTVAYLVDNTDKKALFCAPIVAKMLCNGVCGIADSAITLCRKASFVDAQFINSCNNANILQITATPLDDDYHNMTPTKTLLLEQIDKLKKGEFSEELLSSVKDNFDMQHHLKNRDLSGFVNKALKCFYFDMNLKEYEIYHELSLHLKKSDIIEFANKYLTRNYTTIYKLEGGTEPSKFLENKPTTLSFRDTLSTFFANLNIDKEYYSEKNREDYSKRITMFSPVNGIDFYYEKNELDPLFDIILYCDMGRLNSKELSLAFKYLPYCGTDKSSAHELQKTMYKYAITLNVVEEQNHSYVHITGLHKNFRNSLRFLGEVVKNIQGDHESYMTFVQNELKRRDSISKDAKAISAALVDYAIYGEENPSNYNFTNEELLGINPVELSNKLRMLDVCPHKIFYYGPHQRNTLEEIFRRTIGFRASTVQMPNAKFFINRDIDGKTLFITQNQLQSNVSITSFVGNVSLFNKNEVPNILGYSNYMNGSSYFSGNSNVEGLLQKVLIKRNNLALAAYINIHFPLDVRNYYNNIVTLASPHKNLPSLIGFTNDFLSHVPLSKTQFEKSHFNSLGLIWSTNLSSAELFIHGRQIAKYGIDYKQVFNDYKNMTFEDFMLYYNGRMRDVKYDVCLLTDIESVDQNFLRHFGNIRVLDTRDLFGF